MSTTTDQPTRTYRRRAAEIEAVQVTRDNLDVLAAWVRDRFRFPVEVIRVDGGVPHLVIGGMTPFPGDWLLATEGDLRCRRNSDFQRNFEVVEVTE